MIEDYEGMEWIWIIFDHIPDDELQAAQAVPSGVACAEQLCLHT